MTESVPPLWGDPSLVIAQPSSIVVFFSVGSLQAIEIIISNFWGMCREGRAVGGRKNWWRHKEKPTGLSVLIPTRECASFIMAGIQIFLCWALFSYKNEKSGLYTPCYLPWAIMETFTAEWRVFSLPPSSLLHFPLPFPNGLAGAHYSPLVLLYLWSSFMPPLFVYLV